MHNNRLMFCRESLVTSLVNRVERDNLSAVEFQREFANLAGAEKIAVLERLGTAEALSYLTGKA